MLTEDHLQHDLSWSSRQLSHILTGDLEIKIYSLLDGCQTESDGGYGGVWSESINTSTSLLIRRDNSANIPNPDKEYTLSDDTR